MINLDVSKAVEIKELLQYQSQINIIDKWIINKTGVGSDFLGWVEWPSKYDQNEYLEMKKKAVSLQQKIDYLVVIGIGGSYLGTRCAVEMINGLYPNNQKVKLIYLGNTISGTYIKQTIDFLVDKSFGIVVISKSGTTAEPAISFILAKNILEAKLGKKQACELITIITDKEKGLLTNLADQENYSKFIIPANIGGRYSVLTAVGIFPMLVAGINCDEVFKGAQQAEKDTSNSDILKNSSYLYAVTRYYLYSQKKYCSEMLINYEMQMQMFNEWWKQLFGETEGKERKGLLPISCLFSTDLHSMGQYIQEGPNNLFFETIIKVKNCLSDIFVPSSNEFQELNYLFNRQLSNINDIAFNSVLEAHNKNANLPNIIIEISQMDPFNFGYLTYWFMKACATSAYLLGINPFNQPGVEVYKKNMLTLLHQK